MASINLKHSENAEGNFFVDSSCIDCDTCRWMAPTIFKEFDDQSIVYHQPENEDENLLAAQALISCPTSSIGTKTKSDILSDVASSFPIPISENVYDCGYHSEKSYGATSYFIQSESGNILIDSPRFASPLVKQIKKMGGIKYLFLTHGDDVSDHDKFVSHFNCERIMHENDLNWSAENAEIIFKGNNEFVLTNELKFIPTPGHTKGSSVLLYKDKFLFTGDHLAFSERLNNLYAFRNANWFSWKVQIESMEKLLAYDFEWVLPGHGRRFHSDKIEMKNQMKTCVEWMKKK